jgi:GNAT superfamily N-acetyltransferase
VIRYAEPRDADAIVGLVVELATYERSTDVELTPDLVRQALFGDQPTAYCHVAEIDGTVVGMALWFLNFSTWTGRPGIYLEDLFVKPEYRRHGIGRQFLTTLAALCVERDYRRLEWAVLDWNVDAHAFYRSLGARPQDEWTVWRLAGDALTAVAGRDA